MDVPTNVSVDNIAMLSVSLLAAYNFIYVLLLPVFILVIAVGFQQCRKPSSRSSAVTHSDVFTFNMAALEMVGIVGYCVYIYSFCTKQDITVGNSMTFMTASGQTWFHLLVCLDRFFAVVHPITYLHLKEKAVTVRNVSVALSWLISFGMAYLNYLNFNISLYFAVTIGLLCLLVIIYFCVSVLFVLNRPGPGERGGDRKHVDQTKRRAFNTIAAITVALLLKFGPMFAALMVNLTNALNPSQALLMSVCAQWFSIPSSLVLPLPFLYRRLIQQKRNQ